MWSRILQKISIWLFRKSFGLSNKNNKRKEEK